MNKYDHLRDKARQLRRQGATLTEICKHLALGKSTVYGWIKGLPIARTSRQSEQLRRATLAARRKYRNQREQWYREAYSAAGKILANLRIRDFVVLYLAEGYKRNRNRVSICNSNAGIVQLACACINELSTNPRHRYLLQCHVDNDEEWLKEYWAKLLQIQPTAIKIFRKSNSGQMSRRQWRSEYGVFTIEVSDTRLRCKIQAWMDFLQQEWSQ